VLHILFQQRLELCVHTVDFITRLSQIHNPSITTQTEDGLYQRVFRFMFSSRCSQHNARLNSTLNLTGTQAAGAGVHTARAAVNERLDTADIRLEQSVGADVGVGYRNPESYALTADVTLGHYNNPLKF
jgi:hypothetical protein